MSTEKVCHPVGVAQEEEELVDLQEKYRNKCRVTAKCTAFGKKLQECNDRVSGRKKTAETCMEEMIDFVHCVDHCAAEKFFPKLK